MTIDFRPTLIRVPIGDLRPTQITVGMREVALKRHEIRATGPRRAKTFLGRHQVPAVVGPKGRYHIIDHHHLALALQSEGVREVFVTVVSDLSRLDKRAFHAVLDANSWMHPFDASGKRRPYGDLPKSLDGLVDDPYRSLAGEVRRRGGFAKVAAPFAEFLWADFFRSRVPASEIEEEFDKTVARAVRLARQREADYLPGWSGPQD